MKLSSKTIKENTFADGYRKGINDMIHELSKVALRVSTVKEPHTYMKAVGTHNIELAGQRLKKRFRKVEREGYEKTYRLPCKIGDTVYALIDNRIYPLRAENDICILNGELCIKCRSYMYSNYFCYEDLNKKLFLTNADAENQWKERNSYEIN